MSSGVSHKTLDGKTDTADLPGAPRRARLIAVTEGLPGRTYTLGEEPVVIGRESDADVQVDADQISRHHARIHRGDHGHWVIEDLKSRNGTYVNGLPVEKQTLAFGDRIRLGRQAMFIIAHHDALEQQMLELQRLEAIGQLARGIAHDYNNLISVVLAGTHSIELLIDDPVIDKAETKQCLEEMRQAAKRATELTQQLLEFARGEQGQQVPVDIKEILEETSQLCSRTSTGKTEFIVTAEPDLVVLGDRSQLHQVFMNLCVNAQDAMPEGGSLTFEAALHVHDVESANELPFLELGSYVRITATDTGVGMDEETLRRVFEPFFTTKGKKGTGLGLSTVYGIVKNHGGHVLVQSSPKQGTTFDLFFPTALKPAQAKAATSVGTGPGDRAFRPRRQPDDRRTVLLVDDEENLRRGVSRLLKRFGYKVLEAADGEEAIKCFEIHKEDIRLVMLDVMMPNLGAEETFPILQNLDPDVDVLLISGESNPDVVRDLLSNGARGLLRKPFDLQQLKAALAEFEPDPA